MICRLGVLGLHGGYKPQNQDLEKVFFELLEPTTAL